MEGLLLILCWLVSFIYNSLLQLWFLYISVPKMMLLLQELAVYATQESSNIVCCLDEWLNSVMCSRFWKTFINIFWFFLHAGNESFFHQLQLRNAPEDAINSNFPQSSSRDTAEAWGNGIRVQSLPDIHWMHLRLIGSGAGTCVFTNHSGDILQLHEKVEVWFYPHKKTVHGTFWLCRMLKIS